VDGIASQLHDIPRAIRALKHDKDDRGWILAQAQTERMMRQQGKDKFTSQVNGHSHISTAAPSCFLMPLNSSWDSAGLGLHSVFSDTTEWIVETVRWVLDHSNETIIVRQHPAERFASGRTIDNVGQLLEKLFGANNRVRFIAADSPINTYALLEQAHCVLVHASTIGIEAAMMGKTVITSSNSYYSDMGFVFKGTSRERYFDLISKHLAGKLSLDKDKIEDATYAYYLGQCCNWVFGVFNPTNFRQWANRDIDGLYHLEEVQVILDAIDGNIPIAILQHKRSRALAEAASLLKDVAPSSTIERDHITQGGGR
jgi:hypothetical protein